MPLPSAPEVTIHGPSAVFVGHELAIGVEVTAKHPTKVEFIDVRVVGTEGWAIGSGKHRISHRITFPDMIARVMDAGTLPAGTTRLTARVSLPINTPPSHEIDPAYARLGVRVHVSIPWWPDGRYRFDLPARLAPGSGPVIRTPVAARSSASGADAPRLELGLASMRLIAGETLVGSCAVFHLDDRKPREVTLALTPLLSLHRGRTRERSGTPYTTEVTIPAGGGGTSVEFRFALPATITPSFQATTHSLSWMLEARTGSLLGGRVGLALAIEIVDAAATATTAALVTPPQLGDERIAEVFAAFAIGAGWHLAPPDDIGRAGHTPTVTREVGDAELRIGYVYRGTDGAVLTARLGGPTLGLGLRVTPGSTMRHLFFRDVEVGIKAWDRDHLVTARSATQAVPFLTAMVPALAGERAVGTLLRWDDDMLVFERPVTQVESAELAAIGAGLERLAIALADARRAITPPPGVELAVEAWHELARWLRGRLALGDLSLAGELDTAPVEVELEWNDAVPVRVVIRVGDPAQASATARGVSIALARPADEALALPTLGTGITGAIGERLTEQLAGWPTDIVELAVADGAAAAVLQLPTEGTPRVDAARVRALIEALRTILVTLEPGTSPYR